jgi:ankyrin repeat protein
MHLLFISKIGIYYVRFRQGANVHHQDEEGLTALSWACLRGHYHACETLLAHGSNINHEDINGRMPIDMASFYGDVQLVQLLIDHGSVIDHVDKNGMRALDRAIGCRNVAVVNCLLKKSVKLGRNRSIVFLFSFVFKQEISIVDHDVQDQSKRYRLIVILSSMYDIYSNDMRTSNQSITFYYCSSVQAGFSSFM